MNDEDIIQRVEEFADAGISSELRVVTNSSGRILARSTYEHGDRLVITQMEPVQPDDVPEDRLDDLDDADLYLKEWESYHRTGEEIPADPLLGESPGWFAEESVEGATTYMPVDGEEVQRTAGNQPVPVFALRQHYNFRPDAFEEGGLWEEIMNEDEDDEEAVEA